VHAWWRAATTWFWAKLRARPALRCYYEPLHERLAVLTAAALRAQRLDPEQLRRMGHPPLERPYFAEYLELLEAGGTGLDPALSYERYFLAPEEDDPALERYLRRLIGHAAQRGERAVLCFVRSPLRALWMRRRFGGLHIAQIRNPRDQWGSFIARGGSRGSYFTNGTLLIARRLHRRVPRLFSHLARLPGPRVRAFPEVTVSARGMTMQGESIGHAREYAVFVLLWLASALQSLSAAEIVIDCDRLSADAPARARVGAQLAAQGLGVELDDVAARRHAGLPLAASALGEIEALAVRQLAGDARALVLAHPKRIAARLEYVSSESHALLEAALAALAPR
jgi:hypothetical protein